MSETSKRILWIDDEIEFLRAHVMFLETRGYTVAVASGGDEGIRRIREAGAEFDIVLLDKQMPVKSGAATLDEIKTHWPALPVILLTGCQHVADTAIEKKYDGYLTKPVDPPALLGACKQIIESKEQTSRKLSDRYMRGYAENRALIGGDLSASGWMNLYTSLSRWDLEMDGLAGEGVRQMHEGLRSDSGKKFCDFVIDNYATWTAGRKGSPLMAADVLLKVVAPELLKGQSVLMLVLSGMTLSQFLAIEPVIKRCFSVTATRFISALPTTSNFCLPTLAAGLYPFAVSELEPGVFGSGGGACDPVVMKRLMRGALERAGAAGVKAHYAAADGANGRRHLKAAVDTMRKAQTYGVISADILHKFTDPAQAAKPPKEPVSGETELRRLIESWFINSSALAVAREACSSSCTVILTSDRGHVHCGRPSEIFETARADQNQRSMFSTRVSVDEREIFLLEELPHFRLPPFAPGTKCLMARENCYFALPGKGESSRKKINRFQSGGISPQEMVMPLYICRPSGSDRHPNEPAAQI